MRRDEARLRELGLWPPHGLSPVARATPSPPAAAPSPQSAEPVSTLDWSALEAAVRACRACGLCATRKQAVPGSGDRQARLLIVGEAPGAEEDQRGEPFVGRAGDLLEQMLLAIGLDRRRVYIANVLKCRPPDNRKPSPEEVAACSPYLARQLALLQPAVILALGGFAARALLGGEGRIGVLRGGLHQHAGIPVVVSYHPAYLLRAPLDKLRAWEDLCLLQDRLAVAPAAVDHSPEQPVG